MNCGFRERAIFFGGQRDTPTPCHSEFSPDGGSIPKFAILPLSCEWARDTKGVKMYKIVWIDSDLEPVPGYRTDNRDAAEMLVDAWNVNFEKKITVVEDK